MVSVVIGDPRKAATQETETPGVLLTKLSYAVSGAFLLITAFDWVINAILLTRHSAWWAEYALLIAAFTNILVLLVLISGYASGFDRSRFNLFKGAAPKHIATGVLLGLGISIPTLWLAYQGIEPEPTLAKLIVFKSLSPLGWLLIFLFVVALPIIAEVAFRNVIYSALADCSNVPAAALASALLFAYFWPIFDPATRILFGLLAALAYARTKSLLPGFIAHSILGCSTLASVLLHINHVSK